MKWRRLESLGEQVHVNNRRLSIKQILNVKPRPCNQSVTRKQSATTAIGSATSQETADQDVDQGLAPMTAMEETLAQGLAGLETSRIVTTRA